MLATFDCRRLREIAGEGANIEVEFIKDWLELNQIPNIESKGSKLRNSREIGALPGTLTNSRY